MSGIFGYYIDQKKCLFHEFQKCKTWNQPYGRQGYGEYLSDSCGMGCFVEKLHENAVISSPVIQSNQKRFVIDAVLYNREELLEALKWEKKVSDEELLVEWIEKKGIKALTLVNGDFAGAIIDETEQSVILFRDHMGIRPLYYYARNDRFFFSTDIRGLVALSEVDVSINEEWLYRTINAYSTINNNRTEFEHIYCVKPGSILKYVNTQKQHIVSEEKYWEIGTKKIRLKEQKSYQDKLRDLVSDSVKRRLDAVSGLVGAELSGGLDSGVIDILISRFQRDAVYFSWAASPEEVPFVDKDERLVISDICDQEGIMCHYAKKNTNLDENSQIAHTLKKMGIPIDEEDQVYRYILAPTLNTLPICEAADFVSKQGGRVVFTGHGGDEGVSHRSTSYEIFYNHEYYRYFRHMWSLTHGKKYRIMKTLKNIYIELWKERKQYIGNYQMYYASRELLNDDFAEKFTNQKTVSLPFFYDPISYIRRGGSRNRLDVVSFFGAYNGVRYLVPYLDFRVVDYAVSVPRYLYLKGRRNRYLFRETFKDIMPKSLYVLQNKRDMSMLNQPEDPEWFEKFQIIKEKTYRALTREKWEKYLNFQAIEKWLYAPKPETEEEKDWQENINYCLYLCTVFENMVRKVRETTV